MNTINLRRSSNFSEEHILYPYGSMLNPKSSERRLNVISGDGIFLVSKDGRRYIDAISGLWNVSLGYGNKEIENEIKKQLDVISFCSLFDNTSDTVLDNAKKLLDLHNGIMSKISYTCSGSESIELAIKLMRKYWDDLGFINKKTILSFNNSYHGTSYGALSVSYDESEYFTQYKPGIGAIDKLDMCRENTDDCTQRNNCSFCNQLDKYIKENYLTIAGVIIEPILLSMGVKDICPLLLKKLIDLCKYYDLLVTVDEVATGFYRTGVPFYYQKLNINPDIVCMSKGINSGYLPLGAVCFNDKIVKVLSYSIKNSIIHGSTQGGNILACAASNVCIDIYKPIFSDKRIITLVENFSNVLREELKNICYIKCVRTNGILICIEFLKERFNFTLQDIIIVREQLKKDGLIVYPSHDGILILPMFITKQSDYELITTILKEYFTFR